MAAGNRSIAPFMKVALVTDWYHPRVGGIELHLQDLARRLAIAGIEVAT